MVWFYCDDCGDTIKKPKLANHFRTCHGQTFTCVDCSRSFDRSSVSTHNICVTEHEKYALGVTKPGGYAAQGFYSDAQKRQAAAAAAADKGQEVVGVEFLSGRPPWRCSCCNVNCTSQDTLLGHAAGAKHKRRARAALGLSGNVQQQQHNGTAAAAGEAEAANSKAGKDAKLKAAFEQPNTAEDDTADEQPPNKKHKIDKQESYEKQGKKLKHKKGDKDTKQGTSGDVAEQQAGEQQNQAQAADQQQQGSATIVDRHANGVQIEDNKKRKKAKKEAADIIQDPIAEQTAKQQQNNQKPKQLEGIDTFFKAAQKKLKKKGVLGFKKLEALLQKSKRNLQPRPSRSSDAKAAITVRG
eukprot:GHRR01007432.1.p1 GENE.GHRR01007432.1~~GHRR01007432.1.p1  ORF type:complete len:355 (+),score=147.04 GHRR01007432.1:154-1218(+)